MYTPNKQEKIVVDFTIYQENTDKHTFKRYAIKHDLEDKILECYLNFAAAEELEYYYDFCGKMGVKLFNQRLLFSIDIGYEGRTFQYIAYKLPPGERFLPENKPFTIQLKKTWFIVKPKRFSVKKFIESKLEKEERSSYFKIIEGSQFLKEYIKTYSPILFTGMKD